ncbi:hypothetical protein GSI_01199 [Ganoderma sinense ZZ0214-1]|uniref:Uncharacterized protein n=1 Tax=Ganoderma sinense ZZ0214-1 TaxID=1077348 RepID=A0A2G8SUQ2_9APHY|nr:hypothetical protein GSI_01199 [Ganoderma sinense ZZ0214-1]
MTFMELCVLFLAFAILALVLILASILHEHRSEVADRAQLPAVRNAVPPRHQANNNRADNPRNHVRAHPVPEEAVSGVSRLRLRFWSPLLSSVTDAITSGSHARAAGTSTSSAPPPAPVTGPSTSRSSVSAPVAGPSALRRSLVTVDGPSSGPSASHSPTSGGSVPWSPKNGWTNTARVNGITYHRTEKRMRPRKSVKAGLEEADRELVVTPYWEPENVGAHLIEYPPDLSGDANLAIGDIFIFHTATHYRLWIYRGGGYWQRIESGYRREDGRYLIVTPVKKEPSWVSCKYFERQAAKQGEPDSD